jgi:NTP pyrophosphatase (non-canonical NTP hydrolase)
MNIDEFFCWTMANWDRNGREATEPPFPSLRDKFIMTVGLGGEAGEVQEILKKEVRDGRFDREDLVLEVGDVLHYLTIICHAHNITLGEVITANVMKANERRIRKEMKKHE